MIKKKISMLAVLAAAIALVLTGCVKAPASPIAGSLTGTWQFQHVPVTVTVTAVIVGTSVTVTVDAGGMPISADPKFAKITKVDVIGTLTEDAEEMTFSLTLAEDNPITVDLLTTIPADYEPAERTVAVQAIKEVIAAAQGETVMIDLDTSPAIDTMTVTGSFIDALLMAAGMPVPPGGLKAIRIG